MKDQAYDFLVDRQKCSSEYIKNTQLHYIIMPRCEGYKQVKIPLWGWIGWGFSRSVNDNYRECATATMLEF